MCDFYIEAKVPFTWRQHNNTFYSEQSKYIAKSEVGYAHKQRNLFVLFTQSLFPAAESKRILPEVSVVLFLQQW